MRKVIIIDFGSQYTLLIARELRRLHVYCEVRILNDSLFEDLKENRKKIDALILSGGPHSVPAIEEEPPFIQLVEFLRINAKLEWVDGERKKQKPIPVLAICFGAQLLAHCFGGEVVACETRREYGESWLRDFDVALSTIFTGIDDPTKVWMSHSDSILVGGGNMIKVLARPGVDRDEVAVFQIMGSGRVPMLGLQFHPEVSHTQDGGLWLRNFCLMADVEFSWYPDAFIQQSIKEIRKQVKAGLNREVLVACSGGVDSSVMAVLLNRALGDRCRCVFLNNGLLRAGEFEEIYEIYKQLGLNIQGIDCSSDFYQELVGVTDPEQKRKVIGRVFVEQFQNFVEGGEVGYLAQGTIYPDVVESHGKIKSHHNVGGLPEKLHLELIEPLRLLFKDEVRQIGRQLGIPEVILGRHPFPGPGLGIRILGEVNPERVKMLQEADRIYVDMLKEVGYYDQIWQAGAVLLDCKSVGVMGDNRTYESVVGLRAVRSVNGMTADVFEFPVLFLNQVATRIVNEVVGVNRVVYDVTSKPPGTIEWE